MALIPVYKTIEEPKSHPDYGRGLIFWLFYLIIFALLANSSRNYVALEQAVQFGAHSLRHLVDISVAISVSYLVLLITMPIRLRWTFYGSLAVLALAGILHWLFFLTLPDRYADKAGTGDILILMAFSLLYLAWIYYALWSNRIQLTYFGRIPA
jgi:hypothetical protein